MSGQEQQLHLDIKQNSDSLNISEDIYKRILSKAVEQTEGDIQELERALPNEDRDKIAQISHRFKGDYDNLRIHEMSVLAKEMNEIAKTTFNKEKIKNLLDGFVNYFSQLKEIVTKL